MKVIILKHWCSQLVGIVGTLTGNEQEYNGNTFYEVICNNDGGKITTSKTGTKNVLAWRVGDKLNITIDQFLILC